jgi:4-methyl-5(b-hydroxyethyl)-thiazole monophosphate biosynthesis
MARVLIPLADGVEEMEAVIMVDTLRRARWSVTTASVGTEGLVVKASRGVGLLADTTWPEVNLEDFDMLLLPGGAAGTDVLRRHEGVLAAVRKFVSEAKWVGAICAGPLVLQDAGVLAGRRATCHPSVWRQLSAAQVEGKRVVFDDRIVTSQGPGTAFEFALGLIRELDGVEAGEAVAAGLVLRSGSD